jgi:hypothetical protein
MTQEENQMTFEDYSKMSLNDFIGKLLINSIREEDESPLTKILEDISGMELENEEILE